MHRLLTLSAYLLLTLVPIGSASAEKVDTSAADTLSVSDYLEFEQVGDARISPDGTPDCLHPPLGRRSRSAGRRRCGSWMPTDPRTAF